MRSAARSVLDGVWRGAIVVMTVALLLMVRLPPAGAQPGLPVGESGGDARVTATVTAVRSSDTYSGLPGSWFVVDVTLTGGTGVDVKPLLDWRLVLPDGQELIGFPGEPAKVPDDRVEAGATVSVQLGFDVAGVNGPATLVYRPFLDPDPLASWGVVVEAALVSATTAFVVPDVSFPDAGLPDASLPDASFSDAVVPGVGSPDITIVSPSPSPFGERLRSFDALYDVQADGSILVTETIEYDFGSADRHGIFRDLALFQPLDSDRERRYPIGDVKVSAAADTPAQFELQRQGDFQRIKIGDPDRTIRGVHTYTIGYRLDGALNRQDAGPELYFNVTGLWEVPMNRVSISVRAPGGVVKVDCFAGPTGSSNRCDQAGVDGGVAQFLANGVGAGEQVTIVAAFPPGSVAAPPMLIADAPRDIRDAIEPGPLNIGGAAGVGVLGVAGISALLWRKGRDFESSGSAVDAVMSPDDHPPRRLPLFRRVPTPVQFAPPDGTRPGLVGTLYDERAGDVDVSATIVDLAVRGYLRIEEVEKSGLFERRDFRLVQLRDADETLLTYERLLFTGLFAGTVVGGSVYLSELKNTFAARFKRVQDSMYSETVRRRWFERRPDKVRLKWILIGAGILTVGAVSALGAAATGYGLWISGALVLVGVAFLLAARQMPRRTARGTATLRLVEGFRTFIAESEVHRAKFAERKNLFTEYLPYAMVFGCVDKWTDAFAKLDGGLPDTGGWYVGTSGFSSHSFGKSINSFSSSAGSTMTSTPGGSGGSGFGGGSSGGGGGGGGGGSW